MLNITLNGDAISTDQSNVLALLESLELTQGRFAVEIDGNLVPKSRLADTPITQGMNIEVVQAVGGG
ncbi:thiamine biosynthesis protein ThiS [Moraxella bovoculi]|uniref:Thiamine biosynthesis protein ThiS n=2 Tax=Moraxella TaxID=475 RepID=A0AAC8PW94_9GAMM|nr:MULTISPECIES: sulfur carrier protein ThiS [Moraxella]AKG08173.1 thiamine biosynthesis protein ThiS [Moraxella bovoculi]AKG09271.1 thiamine biosynthesis protein ThiS [Moraxella bovoculi]AKG11105.1 thiamine biosynthesis protein ThiS [Moraxella bovoculi]AKG13097.1 thiamine biosynthesis protein ThiS [Moraxella bovoculi]ANB91085.1 thiamine biosynthesis protein ThiS [Moraxella ovis]